MLEDYLVVLVNISWELVFVVSDLCLIDSDDLIKDGKLVKGWLEDFVNIYDL